MPTYFLNFIFLFTTLSVIAQEQLQPYNQAYLWQGFKHKWSYNHRINRFGNFISTENENVYTNHSSASGLGSDSTYFTSFYSKIQSPNLVFKETKIKISVYGNEGDLLNKVEEIAIKAEDWFQNKPNYRAFINGFEIRSLLKADQIQLLGFNVENPYFCKETGEVKFKATLNISTNCRTVECPIFSNHTAYELTLHVLLMGYENEEAQIEDAYFNKQYVWDKQIEVSDLGVTKMIQGQSNKFPKATAGIRGLNILLDTEHWVKEIEDYITPLNYDYKRGELELQANQIFIEWRKGMERFAVEPKKAMFAKRGAGYAIMQLFPAMIQFKTGEIKRDKVEGTSHWKGWNADSEVPAAVTKIKIN